MSKPEVWMCPRHGDSDAYMHVVLYEPQKPLKSGDSIGANRPIVLQRHYCMHCYVEKLDALGVKDMDRK